MNIFKDAVATSVGKGVTVGEGPEGSCTGLSMEVPEHSDGQLREVLQSQYLLQVDRYLLSKRL